MNNDYLKCEPDHPLPIELQTIQEELWRNERVLRKQWLSAIKGDRAFIRMCNEKIKEFEAEILEGKQYIDTCYKKYCENKDEWRLWQIERERGRIAESEKQIKKFWYYKKSASGVDKKQELNVELAREFPIGDLMTTDGRGDSKRKFYLCPLHNEKTASFCWFIKDNRYWCFGENEGGDVIDLYMRLHEVDFVEAVKKLT